MLNVKRMAALFAALLFLAAPAHAAQTGLSALLGSTETLLFIGINLSLTAYFGFYRFDRFSVTYGPEILTTVGIFGCFVGIALALLNFDSADLSHSIPSLLDGVKTAFWASVSGVGGALVLRARHYTFKEPIPQAGELAKAASLEDVVSSLVALRKGLVGQEEGTMLTQMKLSRQESSDELQKLNRSFEHFAKHMVENNQKAIIEALREVIQDFNSKLTEQFGENFKHLNSAVEKLVVWQQQYKDELERIKLAQERAATDMQSAATSFGLVVDKSDRFASTAEQLSVLLQKIDAQIAVLFEQERSLNEVLSTMKDVTPQFEAKVADLIASLKDGVTSLQGQTAEILKNFGAQSQSTQSEMKALLTDSIIATQKEVHAGLQDNQKVIKDGVIALDKALQKELNDSLETLGRQLASLSNKFVTDYTPLTDRLRDVILISQRSGI